MRQIRIRPTILLTLVMGLLLIGTLQAQTLTGDSLAQSISRVEHSLLPVVDFAGQQGWTIQQRMHYYNIPALSIAVIKDNQILWAKGYGVKDIQDCEPVDVNTLFRACSISKSLTAVAVMKQVENGKLSLSEDINHYLKSWQLPTNKYNKKKAVTLSHLLSHTGGINYHGVPGYYQDDEIPSLLQFLRGEYPSHNGSIQSVQEPGKGFMYSGGGYAIIEQMLNDQTHQDFETLMQAQVLVPLGMNNSTFAQSDDPEFQKRTAAEFITGTQNMDRYNHSSVLAAGGLWSTPSDLAKFVIAMQRAVKGEYPALLSAETAKMILTPQSNSGYGYGFFNNHSYFYHDGADIGYNAMMIGNQSDGIGCVIMYSGLRCNIDKELVKAVANEYGWKEYFNPPIQPVAVSADLLESYCGVYDSKKPTGIHFHVHQKDGFLYFDQMGIAPQRLIPIAEGKFISESGKSIEFTTGKTRAKDSIYISNQKLRLFRVE